MILQKLPSCGSSASLISCLRHVFWQASARTFSNVCRPPSRADPRVAALGGAWIFAHCAKPKVSKNRLPEIESWLTGTCSPGCAKHTLWMTGVPPWCSRCAKHCVKNTWLLWLCKTKCLATSTGRGVPIAQQNIEQEVNYVLKKHAKNFDSRNCLWPT